MIASAKTSFAGVAVRSQAPRARAQARASVRVQAKYGENGKYFDSNDIENTVGAWDMYGKEDSQRYNDLQSKFFTQASTGLSRRESMLAFVTMFGTGSLLLWGAKGAKDAELPITKGPQKPAAKGPRGKI
ncbi:unnamed protein product [Pedinophyceae sp. YPF-701]|nr:unnamed protein product [Pedinophyceae sp. YPF-701]